MPVLAGHFVLKKIIFNLENLQIVERVFLGNYENLFIFFSEE